MILCNPRLKSRKTPRSPKERGKMPKDNRPKIEAKENGPYMITDVSDENTSRGEEVKTAKTMVFAARISNRCDLSDLKKGGM